MKSIIIFFVVLIFYYNCRAQVAVGFSAGPQATTASYTIKNVKQPTDFKYGFHAGVSLKVFFDRHLYFSPGISYSLMGYKSTFNQPSMPPDLLAKNNNTSFHQVDFDFLLQYDFGNDPAHFFVKAGPAISYIISGREEFDLITGEYVKRKMKYGITSDYGPYLGSMVMDLGYETNKGFIIYAYYIHGLASMNNVDGGPQIKPRVIGLSVGILLNSKKFSNNK